jgi:hypothetical protein
MLALRQRQGIMATRAPEPSDEFATPVTELYDGLAPPAASVFAEPHQEGPG